MKGDFVLHLPAFEGPLDLLLYLIEKNRFTLENLEVCPIVEQYLIFIETFRSLDITLAGEFLDMASYLIWLKSCLLLPVTPETDEDRGFNPAKELKEMLMAYRALKQASSELKERPMLFRDKFPRGLTSEDTNLSILSMGSLLHAINAIKTRTKQYVMNVQVTRFSLREMMAKIFSMFENRNKIALNEIVQSKEKSEFVGVFMAALEMSRVSIARLIQKELFSKIYLVKR